jgi:hypothetical protein
VREIRHQRALGGTHDKLLRASRRGAHDCLLYTPRTTTRTSTPQNRDGGSSSEDQAQRQAGVRRSLQTAVAHLS